MHMKWLSTVKRADSGSLVLERMELDETGFPQPTGELEELSADSLVLALGQETDLSLVEGVPGIEVADGVVQVGPNMMTGHPGIFAGRDMVPAERTVAVAIGHGKRAARHIDAWLRGKGFHAPPKHSFASFDRLNPWYYATRRARCIRSSTWPGPARPSRRSSAGWTPRPRSSRRAGASRAETASPPTTATASARAMPSSSSGPKKQQEIDLEFCKGCGLCAAECPMRRDQDGARRDLMRAMVLERAGEPQFPRRSRCRSPKRARCFSASTPAPSAGPTFTSWTASSRDPKLPLVPGHQIVGTVERRRARTASSRRRVGVPWLGWTCGECRYCRAGARTSAAALASPATTLDGGYAEYAVADERFCFPIPDGLPGLAGGAAALRRADRLPLAAARRRRRAARALRLRRLRAHRRPGGPPPGPPRLRLHARPGTRRRRRFALELGAEWAGDALGEPPEELDAAIIFAPVGELVPAALAPSRPAGPSSAPGST